jgi:hypothetical protein
VSNPIINHHVGRQEFVGDSKRFADVFDSARAVATKSVRLATTSDLDAAASVGFLPQASPTAGAK